MAFPDAPATVIEIFTGRIADRWPGKAPSAILRRAVGSALTPGPDGFPGDEHADPAAHGGPDKVLHHYPAEHHAYWRETLGSTSTDAFRFEPGAVGENISSEGVVETDLCIGDILRIGDARVQVSLGRQPCWKLDAHTGHGDMAYRFRKTGRTGWYYRLLTPGAIAPGAVIALEARPQPDWRLDRVIAARFDPRLAPETAAALGALPELGRAWATGFQEKAGAA